MNLPVLLAFFSWFSALIPLVVSLFLPKETIVTIWIGRLTLISFSTDSIIFFLAKAGLRNLWAANIYFLVQFLIVILVISLINESKDKKLVLVIGVAATLSFIINFIWGESTRLLDSYSTGICSIAIMALSIRFFKRLLVDLPTTRIDAYPAVWIVIAIFLYYSGTFILLISNNFLVTFLPEIHRSTWAFHNMLNSVKNILFGIALWQSIRASS